MLIPVLRPLHTFIRILVHFTQLSVYITSFSCGQASLCNGMAEIIIVFINFKDFKTQCRFNLEDIKEGGFIAKHSDKYAGFQRK